MIDFTFISQLVQAALRNQKYCKVLEAKVFYRAGMPSGYTLALFDGAFWNATSYTPKESL